MVRTQVYFSEEQHHALRHAAQREGVSMTALLRRMVDCELLGKRRGADHAEEAVAMIADLGRSGRSDISETHDEALAEALRDSRIR